MEKEFGKVDSKSDTELDNMHTQLDVMKADKKQMKARYNELPIKSRGTEANSLRGTPRKVSRHSAMTF